MGVNIRLERWPQAAGGAVASPLLTLELSIKLPGLFCLPQLRGSL